MEPGLLTILMFSSFFALLALGIPLAWTTGSLGLIFAFFLWGPDAMSVVVLRVWDVMGSFSMIAIPLFVFMGNMLQKSGIAHDLFKAIQVWVGGLRGGIAAATILLCTVLAAMIGTVGADVTITGLIALPFMFQRGYDRHMALGSIVAGGALGVLVPPSIMFIVYGVTVGESIGKLFMGGVGPGLLFGGLYIAYILIKCYLDPSAGPAAPEEERNVPLIQKIALFKSLILPIGLILGVMGSIFGGIATPGEAAGVGALGAILCAGVRKQLDWNNLSDSLYETMKTVGLILWIVFGAMVFIATYTLGGGAEFVKTALVALPLNPWLVLIIIQVILLFLGMVLDIIGITVLLAPIFVPVITELGFDPLWFGVIFNLNLQIAYLSPPFGYSIFYLKAVAPPDVTMADLYKSVLPYMALQIVGMILCMVFPQIILWLPNLMVQ
ncbi:TRAP transporter, DctM subunit [Desulfocicer vacuolatum DSM 3385]|uniref:TRAP transporter, DctM subunit n=1 Tax=Desulfocicer vacuolatum DSM 3385 TaxID=1121400 RepID=A0A1W2AWQ4_9BACT|nr:TRAP transporter large permease subunit [Desulfocicer vacuolatum]SMC65145.1 TRAP transporter, DctM subunit [Desulfocicer vacuolatum DSM 3385]